MKITKITPQAKNSQRVNVFVNGDFYCGVDEAVAWRLRLKPGLSLTPQLAQELSGQDDFERGWNYALKCLQIAPQSKQRLGEKLQRRLENSELAKQIMQWLEEADLINDLRLGEAIIRKYTSAQTKSAREIALILRRKGIDSEIISQLASQLRELPAEEAIQKLAEAKLARVRDEDPKIRFEKTAAYLIRKGFKYSDVKPVVEKLLA